MRKKIISYSLFGYGKERQENCFDFNSYLRGLMVNMRLRKLLFPEWTIRLHMDESTYIGFEAFFSELQFGSGLEIVICEDAALTKAMLWRMMPLYDADVSHVLCRDLDSPLTYRDAQAVAQWIDSGKAAHAITDSVSHNLPMLGGMVGFLKDNFAQRTGKGNWSELVSQMSGYERKGADQDLLNRFVYPKFADGGNSSIMQHYFLGMANTFLNGYRRCDCHSVSGHKEGCHLDYSLTLPTEYKDSNAICGHIGAGGYYEGETLRFLGRYVDKFEAIRLAEKPYNPSIFNWNI